MFYGMPSRIIGKDGKTIHGTLGFVGALLKILRMTNPTHVVVLFDGEHVNNRKQLDANYKSNRPDYIDVDENEIPFSQLPYIYAALDFLCIKHRETSSCEVDDWIAAYSLLYGRDNEVIIASYDSDFFQLINDNVKVLRYRGNKSVICDEAYMLNKLGVAPDKYVLYKSLVGDSADNIAGVLKVGPKTAATLVNSFENIDELIANKDKIVKKCARESVANNIDRIKLNYKLIKLHGDVDLPFDEDEIVYTISDITTMEVMRKIGLI